MPARASSIQIVSAFLVFSLEVYGGHPSCLAMVQRNPIFCLPDSGTFAPSVKAAQLATQVFPYPDVGHPFCALRCMARAELCEQVLLSPEIAH